jgi:hypothetical protein
MALLRLGRGLLRLSRQERRARKHPRAVGTGTS